MKYYKLYVTHTGRRNDGILIEQHESKKHLQNKMWDWKRGYHKHSKLFIREVNEVEVDSTS